MDDTHRATSTAALTTLVAALAQLTEGVIVTDAAGRIVFVNEAAARLHGVASLDVAPEEYAATYALFTEDGQPYPSEELPLARAVLRGETVTEARWIIRRPDDTKVVAVGSARPVFGDGGVRVGAVLTVRDDSARTAAEHGWRESAERSRALLSEVGESNAQLLEQTAELNYVNMQLQDAAAEMEVQSEELQATTEQLEERTVAAEYARRDAEAAERQLEEAFTQAPAAIAVTIGREHRFALSNATFASLVGRVVRAGSTMAEALPEVVAQGFVQLLDQVYDSGVPYVGRDVPATLRPDSAGGEEILGYFDFVYQPLRGSDGRVYGIMQLGVNVTERVRARDLLESREREIRTVADAIPTLAWTARADGFIEWYNARWYEYTGTTPAQMEGWGWQSVHDRDMLPSVLERWQSSIATGKPFEMTFPLLGADGLFRSFLTRVSPVTDETGVVLRWFGTNTDVEIERAARDAAEQAARRTERLQALTSALAGATSVDDVAAIVVAQAVESTGAATGMMAIRIPGTDEAEIIQQTGLTAPVMSRYARFTLTTPGPSAQSMRTGEPIFIDSLEGPEGLLARFPEITDLWTTLGSQALATVPLIVRGEIAGVMSFTFGRGQVLTHDDSRFFLSLSHEAAIAIERARLLEAEFIAREAAEAARLAAEQSNQAKTDFLATMSHELRTPLNAIAGYAELIEIGIHGPVTDEQKEALSRIQRSQRHLLGLINDVLNFAKLDAGHVEFDLEDVNVRIVVEALEPLVGPQLQAKKLRYSRDLCTEGPVVRADRDKLQQILVNLMSNAIKFTPEAGSITLECTEAGEQVSIAVSDTGIGIAEGRLDHVFEPFVQLHRALNAPHEGTGLGLAISRDLARGMGGDLTVASVVGMGSTFTLTLPRGGSEAT